MPHHLGLPRFFLRSQGFASVDRKGSEWHHNFVGSLWTRG